MTWLRCVEHLDRIYAPERLRAGLVTTCRRECLRLLRLRSRVVLEDTSNSWAVLANVQDDRRTDAPEDRAVRREIGDAVGSAVADLPEHQRRVVCGLLAVDGFRGAYATVADSLGVPIGSLGPTRQRALQRLRRDRRLVELRA